MRSSVLRWTGGQVSGALAACALAALMLIPFRAGLAAARPSGSHGPAETPEATPVPGWTTVQSPPGFNLLSVSAWDMDYMKAVSDDGAVVTWNGQAWSAAPGGVDSALNAITNVAADDGFAIGWAVGDYGVIRRWHWVGGWTDVDSPTYANLTAVAMAAPDDGWAVGWWPGTLLHWDGQRWSVIDGPDIENEGLTGVALVNSNVGWAVGWSGLILRWLGHSGWSRVASPTTADLAAVAAISARDVWAVGQSGTILHWDGATWSAVESPTSEDLSSVTMADTDWGWAVGKSGAILHWDGSRWALADSPSEADLTGVTVAGRDAACAVGREGTILHYGIIAATPAPSRTPTRTPRPTITSTPTITPGPSPTPTATPLVRGSVELNVDYPLTGCHSIGLTGVFSATSAVAPVGEQRISLRPQMDCRTMQVPDAEWRPFAPTDHFTISDGPHYFQAALDVQYRDELGNLSPVYCASAQGVCLGTPTPPPCADEFEPDDSVGDATVVTVGAEPHTSVHSICPEGDVDFVAFDASREVVYRLSIDGYYYGADIRLQLYGTDGQSEIALNDTCSGGDFCARWTPSESGLHYVRAAEARPGYRSPYDTYRLGLAVGGHVTAEPPRQSSLYLPLLSQID